MEMATLSSNPSHFQRLPLMLQLDILSYFVFLPDQSPLQAILRTCKWLYNLALPFSVRTFRNHPPSQGRGFCSERRNAQFLRYILLTRPELAKFVDTIILGSFTSDPNVGYDAPVTDEEEDQVFDEYRLGELALYQQLMVDVIGRENSQEFMDEWVRDLRMGSSDAQLSLLLISCPNLRLLCFETPHKQRHFSRILQLSSSLSTAKRPSLETPLSQLQDIYIEANEDLDFDYIDESIENDRNPVHFFKLSNLRSFEGICVVGGDDMRDSFRRLPARSSSVEVIAMRRSYISPGMLQSMLGACTAVKELEITRGLFLCEFDEVQSSEVLQAVLPHADSLESLYLNLADERPPLDPPILDPEFFMGRQLKRMTKLKKLVTGMPSLTGFFNGYTPPCDDDNDYRITFKFPGAASLVDCLPENLEYLEIHGCGEQILDQAQELILVIQGGTHFRQLKHIRLLFSREKVNLENVQLSYDPSIVRLEIVFQSFANRTYDLIPRHAQGDCQIEAICSSIYANELREQWLNIRGKDIGRATIDLKLDEGMESGVPLDRLDEPQPRNHLPDVVADRE